MSPHRFDFSLEYIFENDVVKLSPLRKEHVEALVDISNDDEIWTYFLETGQGKKELKTYIQTAIQNRQLHQEYSFVIFDKFKNKYAGMTRLYDLNPELGTVKMGHTWLGKDFWGTRLNKYCKFLLFEFVFENLGFERIGFGVHGENLRSINALKSIGCQQEGVLRNFLHSVSEKKRVDLLLFSLLKSEWNENVKIILAKKLR